MSIFPLRPLTRPSPPLDRLAAEGGEQRSQAGWIGAPEWEVILARALSRAARAYGLPEPKGIALIGIPGSGKSLTAKMVAGLWGIPLLRLDIGALYGSLVGESEENAMRA